MMSFLGVFPLGIYVVLHLWTNLSAWGGPVAFNTTLQASRHHPAFLVLELLLGAAILIHLTIGIRLILRWRPNTARVPTFSNLKFTLQRLSGLGLALFLVAHLINARIMPALDGRGVEDYCGLREAYLHHKATLPVYILGLLGIAFHLANGLWTFCLTWGFTVTPRSQRVVQTLSFVVFVALLALSAAVLYGFMQPWHTSWGLESQVCHATTIAGS